MKQQLTALALLFSVAGFSQTVYSPIFVTGYNQDVIAESVPAASSTTGPVDGSDYVLYNQDYGNVFSTGTGLPNNGQVTTGTRSYQLAPYTMDNAILLSTGQTDSLELAIPDAYASISLLGFSTEGDGTILLVLKFTDGSATVIGSSNLPDWFFNPNPVIGGFDRTGRSTDSPDFQFGQPQMYAIDVDLSCADQGKLLRRILIINTTSSPTIKTAVFALSGATLISADIGSYSDVTCFQGADGTASVATTGGVAPLTYAWSSNPVQTTIQATGLSSGQYWCVVTDGMGCPDSMNVIVSQPGPINSSQSLTICDGESTQVGNTTHTTAGTYTDILTAANGCDSTVTTVLTVNSVSSTGVSVSGLTLTAAAAGAQFQWLDCGNSYAAINGATSVSYTASVGGNYAVEITEGGCVDTSACMLASLAGLDEWHTPSVELYPNPVTDYLAVQSSMAIRSVEVVDLSGKQQTVDGTPEHLFVGNLVKGVYLVQITTTEGITAVYRIVKQ